MNAPPLEAKISKCVARYSPPIAAQLRTARRRLRRMFPRGHELVYDNYNALVFAFGPTERASQIVLSIAGYPRWVTLFFLHGATLADPQRLLVGSGSQVRGVRLQSPQDLDRAPIRALIARARAGAEHAFETAPPLRTIFKSAAAKLRPRRPAGDDKGSGPRAGDGRKAPRARQRG